MARKNRVSVYDGIYHVTARIAHRAMLLAEDEIKDKIMEWIVSIARFSGVEVWSFMIMDNHLHLFVHVPPVSKRLWIYPEDEPCAHAFGMRPQECREPLWSPAGDSPRRNAGNQNVGDRPLSDAVSSRRVTADSRPVDCPPSRPSLGFMLDW